MILPRPRFALRLVDGAGTSGRIVSPPPSPLMSSHKPDPNVSIQPRPGPSTQKALKKARSMGNLMSSSPSTSPSPPDATGKQEESSNANANARTHTQSTSLKPPRPRSFAWDDLALPSPVPSLAKYVCHYLNDLPSMRSQLSILSPYGHLIMSTNDYTLL